MSTESNQRKTTRFTLGVLAASFVIIWAAVQGCGQPMSVANQRANTGNNTSAKRQEPKVGKTDADEIKAEGANADKEGSDVKPDPSGNVKATIPPLLSDRPSTPEASVTDRSARSKRSSTR